MESLFAILFFIVLFLVLIWLATLTLRIGASWAGIAKSRNTVGRALLALILSWLVIGFFGGAGSFVPGFGNILGVLIGIALNGLIVGMVYSVGFGKGCQIYILSIVAQVVIVFVAFLVLGLLGVAVSL